MRGYRSVVGLTPVVRACTAHEPVDALRLLAGRGRLSGEGGGEMCKEVYLGAGHAQDRSELRRALGGVLVSVLGTVDPVE